jgi:hypothetical protein
MAIDGDQMLAYSKLATRISRKDALLADLIPWSSLDWSHHPSLIKHVRRTNLGQEVFT